MSKLSQRELLTEGFLDTIRSAAKATAKAAGAVGGAALGAAKNVGKDLLYMNPSANLFTAAGTGAKQGAITGYNVAKGTTTSLLDRLKEELKNSYYDTFNFETIKYGKTEKNEVNKNVSKIAFEATRKNSTQPEQFSAVIIDRGSNKYDISIRGMNDEIIQPNARRNRINFDNKLNRWKVDRNISAVDYNNIKDFLKNVFQIADPTPVLTAAGITSNASTISSAQLTQLKSILKSFNLVECTQLDTLQQLKILF
jgi:hypothetical protein